MSLDTDIAALRRFSRFYTRRIGLLHEGFLGGPLTLTEGRLVYELGQEGALPASRLATLLELDQGYLSRLLRGLEEKRLIARSPSPTDGRQSLVSLTEIGRAVCVTMEGRSRREIAALLGRLFAADRARLVEALGTAETLLSETPPAPEPWLLRPPRPGDMGLVVQGQARLYAETYGWDSSFEALVAEIVAKFLRDFDPQREACWIAERAGAVVGSVFLVRDSETVGKLRLLYVDPATQGLGIGKRLVRECLRFARQAGYAQVTLWTNDILTAARAIYRAEGFQLVSSEPHHSFGKDLVGEYWRLDL